MKKIKLIIIALVLMSLTQVISTPELNYLTMNRGLIINHAVVALNGGGGQAILENDAYFLFRGAEDVITFENGFGQDWEWSVPYIPCNSIPVVNPFSFYADDIYTIIGAPKHAGDDAPSYRVDFIKMESYGTEIMRVAGVYETVVPEIGTYALMLGLAAMFYLGIKKRKE